MLGNLNYLPIDVRKCIQANGSLASRVICQCHVIYKTANETSPGVFQKRDNCLLQGWFYSEG